MKMKYLIIVGLVLAILTIGAASATDEVASDDAVAADNVTEDPIEEVAGDEVIASAPLTEEDFDVEVEEIIALNSNEGVISFYCRDEQTNGSITVYVDENEDPAVDQTVEAYMEFGLNLNQLGITTAGIHKLVANYVPASGDSIKLVNTTVNVTEEEGYTGLNAIVNNVFVNDYNGVAPLVYYSCGLDHGNILIYVDNEVYYNKTVTSEEVIYLENLDKKIVCGKRFVQVKYFDGENTTLVKSRMAKIDYKFGVFEFYEDVDDEVHVIYLEEGTNVLLIDAPKDITGDLYVIFNGTEHQISYENGRGEFIIPEEAFKVGSSFNLSVQYRGDEIYPFKTITYEVKITFRVKSPYLMSIGDDESISVDLPSEYYGDLIVYSAVVDPDDSNKLIKGDEFDSTYVSEGKASISLSELPMGQSIFIVEFVVDDVVLGNGTAYILVMENSDNISASVEPTSIGIGDNVTVEIISKKQVKEYFEIYVDDERVETIDLLEGGEKNTTIQFTEEGDHKIKVFLYSMDEDTFEEVFFSQTFTVSVKPIFDVSIYNVRVNGFEDSEDPLVYYYNDDDLEGNILIYIGDELYYNKTLSVEGEIYVSDLDKILAFDHEYLVQVKYFDGAETKLVKSKNVTLAYSLFIGQLVEGDYSIYAGKETILSIFVPEDATGDLYVIVDGNETKIGDIEYGRGEFTLSAESLELGKNITISVELRGDEKYPVKTVTYNVTADFRVEHPYEMVVGDEEFLSIELPSKYSGVLKVYTTIEDPYGSDNYIKDAEYDSAEVINGKASISLSKLAAKDQNIIVEFTSGTDVYSQNVWLDIKENSKEVSATVEPASIEVGNTVTVKITGNSSLKQLFRVYVDDENPEYVSIYGVGEKSVAIQLATVGDHKIWVYGSDEDGEGEYEAVFFSKTFTVTVKAKEAPSKPSAPTTPSAPAKKATKITAKKATFKAKKKVKKYTITLKAGKAAVKKVKVTLKIGKKTFKATTNAKGKATFKIKKLTKKGKYNAVVKFAGKGNYLKTSKKVKIIIK